MAAGITEFQVKVNKGILLPVGYLIWPSRRVRADHLTSLAFRPQSLSLAFDLERKDLKDVRSSGLVRNYKKNGKKKCWNNRENSASWAQVREFNFILFTRAGHHMAFSLLIMDRLSYS